MKKQGKSIRKSTMDIVLVLLAGLIALGIFFIDINVPLGIAIGTGYTTVILYSWLLRGAFASVYAAIICTILVIIGFILSPEMETAKHIWGINRLISVVIIWLTAALVSIAKQSFLELEKARDTLEQKVLERTEKLQKSEEQLRLMIEDIQNYSIILISPAGIVENWNRGAFQMQGYDADEIIGASYEVFFTEESKKNNAPSMLLNTAINEGRVQDEGWLQRKNGTLFWASLTLTAIYNEDDYIVGFSKLTRDLTERRQNTEIQKAHAVLEAKNEELGQFTYIASHDLQEPLITIKGYLQLLEEDYLEELGEEGKFFMDTIARSVGRMSNLVKDLLDYSRIGKSKERKEVKTREIVDEVIKDLAGTINRSKAKIKIGKLPKVIAYPTEYRQLFQNLISNGIKFQQKGNVPEILINSIEEDVFWKIAIQDNGIGIGEEQQQKIFMIFKRLYSKHTYEGTGIGLATCQKIVELHGGKIWVESKIGKGSTFYFTIPK